MKAPEVETFWRPTVAGCSTGQPLAPPLRVSRWDIEGGPLYLSFVCAAGGSGDVAAIFIFIPDTAQEVVTAR